MAFSDPQSITIGSDTFSLPRTLQGRSDAAYSSADGTVTLSAGHLLTKKGRARRTLRVDHSKITSDPFISSNNTKVSMSNYIVFDVPLVGYSVSEILDVYTGFKSAYAASTDAMIHHLLGGES